MSNVAFLNRDHVPSKDEKDWFYFLQKETNNIRNQIDREEPDKYWRVVRWSLFVNTRRAKFKLIDGGKGDSINH